MQSGFSYPSILSELYSMLVQLRSQRYLQVHSLFYVYTAWASQQEHSFTFCWDFSFVCWTVLSAVEDKKHRPFRVGSQEQRLVCF